MIREEDEMAYSILTKKYEPLISKKSKTIFNFQNHNGFEFGDLIQEGKIGLMKAIKNYDERGSEFITFAHNCIENEINSLNRKYNSKKSYLLNEAMVINNILEKNEISIEQIAKYNMRGSLSQNILMQNIKEALTKEEYLLLILKVYGYSLEEIAQVTKLNRRYVSYKNGRIRQKLKNVGINC